MPSQPDPASHPWRRFLRFSVRGLIVLVLVIGTGLGWIVREAHVQRDAVAALVKVGGGVTYDWEWRDGNWIPGGQPWAPSWLSDLIGVDYFGHVTGVWLVSPPTATDALLAHVGRLTRLEVLHADGQSVSDAGLAHLRGLTKLSYLRLGGAQVTDAGLAHLEGLTSLSGLKLCNTLVTDTGLVHLKGLTKLADIDLGGTQVTDDGLADLKKLTNLKSLDVSGTEITDAGVNELNVALPSLTIIR
jgi:hypothetical protein